MLNVLLSAVTIILAGQSNAVGRGRVLPEDRIADTAPILVMRQQQGIRDSQEPWGGGTTAGRTLAQYFVEHYDNSQVWIVACAVGGTYAHQWLPNAPEGYLTRCVDMAKRAESFGAPVVGVAWIHGETDSGNALQAPLYGDRLTRIIAGFRTRLNKPDLAFVAAELVWNVPEGKMLWRQNVVNQTQNVLDADPCAAYVSTHDLTAMVPGQVHWERGALRVIGARMGQALVNLLGGGH